MAYTNFVDSPFVTVGTANQALPSAVNLGAAVGVVVTDGSTITTTTSGINTAGRVLTANASGVPTFQAPSGLPTIPGGSGPYRLVTTPNTGVTAWACRKPHIVKALVGASSTAPSVFPSLSSSTNPCYAVIDDELFGTSRLNITGSNTSAGAWEGYDNGAAGNVVGQNLYYSIYCKSGFPTSIDGYHSGTPGWASWADLLTSTLNSQWYATGLNSVCNFWWDNPYPSVGIGSQNTSLNTPTTGTYQVNFNATILSCGMSMTNNPVTQIKFTLWQHNATTGSLISQVDFTPTAAPSTFIASTTIVPLLQTGYNKGTTNPVFCIMSSGYPAISGYTYFYDR